MLLVIPPIQAARYHACASLHLDCTCGKDGKDHMDSCNTLLSVKCDLIHDSLFSTLPPFDDRDLVLDMVGGGHLAASSTLFGDLDEDVGGCAVTGFYTVEMQHHGIPHVHPFTHKWL